MNALKIYSLCKYGTFSTVKDPAARQRDGRDAIRTFERSCARQKRLMRMRQTPDTKRPVPVMMHKWAINR